MIHHHHPFASYRHCLSALSFLLGFILLAPGLGCYAPELRAQAETQGEPTASQAAAVKDGAAAVTAEGQNAAGGLFIEPPPPSKIRVTRGKIQSGDTLAGVMMAAGVQGNQAHLAVQALIDAGVDVRRVQLGRAYVVESDAAGKLLHFAYAEGPSHRFQVDSSPSGAMRATRSEGRVELREMVITGVIESNLSQAVYEAGGGNGLTQLLVDVFQWDINFYSDARVGDTFEVLFLKEYVDGRSTGVYDRILTAHYNGKFVGERQVYSFNDDYFDTKGRYARKNFLSAPLDVLRVTSRYGQRFHPIHKKWKKHGGIDYGAARGTSVWAVADGKVSLVARRKTGWGNHVRIRHANGFETLYAHLHRINVVQGQRVKQKMKIGSVGDTGTATAPHLHFEVRVNGKLVDPQKQKMIPGRPIPKAKKAAFEAEKTRWDEKLESLKGEGPAIVSGGELPFGFTLAR